MDSQTTHTPQPPKTPLPHFYVDEKVRGFKQWAAIISLSVVVLLIPLGVYLVGQRTNILPQAANNPASGVGLKLETRSDRVSDGAQFPVEVKFSTAGEDANLIAVKLKYPAQYFEVVKIEKAANFQFVDFVKEGFNNATGEALILGAVPNPGIKTDLEAGLQTLATITFRAKGSAVTAIAFEGSSGIFRNSDNQNLIAPDRLSPLGISINFSAASTPAPPVITPATESGYLTNLIDVPNGGEVYSYYKSVPINWDAKKLKSVKALSLYINNAFFAELSKEIENTGRVLWQPATTLVLAYINPKNTYKIEVEGLDKDGSVVKDISQGPFGLVARPDFDNITATASAVNLEAVSLADALMLFSKLLSNYNLDKLANPQMDLNGDGVINDIDLYLLKEYLKGKKLLSD